MVSKEKFFKELLEIGSSYEYRNHVKKYHRKLNQELTIDEIFEHVLKKIDNSQKYYIIEILQDYFNNFIDMCRAVDRIYDDYYKIKVIGLLHSHINNKDENGKITKGLSKKQIYILINKFMDDHKKLDCISIFREWFKSFDDFLEAIDRFNGHNDDRYRIDFIKDMSNKLETPLDKEQIFTLCGKVDRKNAGKLVKFYKNYFNSEEDLLRILKIIKLNMSNMSAIKELQNRFNVKLPKKVLFDHVKHISDDYNKNKFVKIFVDSFTVDDILTLSKLYDSNYSAKEAVDYIKDNRTSLKNETPGKVETPGRIVTPKHSHKKSKKSKKHKKVKYRIHKKS